MKRLAGRNCDCDPRAAGDHLHADGTDIFCHKHVNEFAFIERVQQTDINTARFHVRHFFRQGFANAQHHIGILNQLVVVR